MKPEDEAKWGILIGTLLMVAIVLTIAISAALSTQVD